MEEPNEFETYYLSDAEYYFKYRRDRNNPKLWRATLWNRKGDLIDDISVTSMTHHQVINRFEVKVM